MDYPRYYIQEFKKYLSLQTSSTNTIKNYLSDLRLFFNFIVERQRQTLTPQSLPSFISLEFLKSYEDFLSSINPPATTKRRLSSLKKFIDYCATQDISPAPTITIAPPPLPSVSPVPPAPEPPLSYPIPPETLPATPPDYSHISHPLPVQISPPTPTPPDDVSNLVKSLADQVPSENVSLPTLVSPGPVPGYSPNNIPDQKPGFSPYLVATAAFLVTFLLTFLISLFLTTS